MMITFKLTFVINQLKAQIPFL